MDYLSVMAQGQSVNYPAKLASAMSLQVQEGKIEYGRKYTAHESAKLLGVSPQVLSQWRKNKKITALPPDPEALDKREKYYTYTELMRVKRIMEDLGTGKADPAQRENDQTG